MKFKVDSFVIAIVISILLAYFFPQLGASNSPIPINRIASIGISLIFLFYGLKLDNKSITNGLKNWRLHVLVQGSTFIIFPLIVVFFFPFVKDTNYESTWLAFLFMAALPSSVSSSVVLVSMAKGNLTGAIFNASMSGIIGILITPFWIGLFISQTHISYDFTEIYLQLVTEIVVPLTIGLLLRKWLGSIAQKNTKKIDFFDKFIVLLIIYKSFVHSFEEKIFGSFSWWVLLSIFGLVIILFFTMFFLTGYLGKLFKFNRPDQITIQYCGTKKSLIHGTVFSKALFGQSSAIGLILLPLMIYHAFQILIISFHATKEGSVES